MPPSVDDGCNAPSWITTQFLEDVLRSDITTGDVSVVSRDVELAVGKGENYLSTLYRVKVQYRRGTSDTIETCYLIVKGIPEGEFIQNVISQTGVFDRELNVYAVALPEMYSFAEKRLKNVPQFSAKCYPTSRKDTLVLEDLRHQGFRMVDRKSRLDLQHSSLVIKCLAQLHGISAALHQHNPNVIGSYGEVMWGQKSRERLSKILPEKLKALANTIKIWPNYEKYADKIMHMIPTAVDGLIELSKPRQDEFLVLNHGDCWMNNFMFKYSPSGLVTDIRLVDFQMSRFSSPAMDLSYFLYSSPQDEVKLQCKELLLKEYHEVLSHTLRDLGYSDVQFTLQDLRAEMEKKLSFGFFVAVNIMPAVLADNDDVTDFSQMKQEDISSGNMEALMKPYNGIRFREAFQVLLPHFDEMGMFE